MVKKGDGRIKQMLDKFKNSCKKKFGIESVILFGSSAKGKNMKDTDIDLIIISNKYSSKDYFTVTPMLFEEWHEKQDIGYPVDFLLFSTAEFNKLKDVVGIINHAMKQGIVI